MKNTEKGFLKWLTIIVIGIIIASFYFDFSIQETVENEQTQSNFTYVWNNIVTFYASYLAEKVDYLWSDIFIDLIWEPSVDFFRDMKAGDLSTFKEAAPSIIIPE